MHSIYGNNGFESGNRGPVVLGPINAALSNLSEQGATVFVPGLTELPQLFDQLRFPTSMKAINTAAIYARHALALTEAGSRRRFKVGIVGGVGPAATVDFMSTLSFMKHKFCNNVQMSTRFHDQNGATLTVCYRTLFAFQ